MGIIDDKFRPQIVSVGTTANFPLSYQNINSPVRAYDIYNSSPCLYFEKYQM